MKINVSKGQKKYVSNVTGNHEKVSHLGKQVTYPPPLPQKLQKVLEAPQGVECQASVRTRARVLSVCAGR